MKTEKCINCKERKIENEEGFEKLCWVCLNKILGIKNEKRRKEVYQSILKRFENKGDEKEDDTDS